MHFALENPLVNPLVSFLVPDIGAPTIGAAVKLARMLEPDYRTEIIGPDFGRGICSLYRNAYPFHSVPAGRLYRLPDYWWERARLAGHVKGDLVVAVKAFATTVPVALALKRKRGVPVAVYLDEWDGALWAALSGREKWRTIRRHAHHPAEACYLPWVEGMLSKADQVWSTTTWLQRRFGGEIVHAGVDGRRFQPQDRQAVSALRDRLGLAGKKVIVFGGVVRPHKGVEEILAALRRLRRDDIRLLVVGPVTEHLEAMMRDSNVKNLIVVAGDAVHAATSLNADIHRQMPLYLDVGDMVVLPLQRTMLAESQMPIKVFEALAMAKPVIGTAVSDLPLMLEGCGLVVAAGDVDALAQAIARVADNPDEASRMGQAARRRCVELYDVDVVRRQLLERVRHLLGVGAES